jgi:hypothetical protein
MRFNPIAVAVAAALVSFGAVAQEEKRQESQAGQSPSMSQEHKPASGDKGGAAAGASSDAKAKDTSKAEKGSAAAGGSASTPKTEGHSDSGGVTSSERTAEPKSDKKY